MPQERILDIGIGSGGAYIAKNIALHEQRIGIDINSLSLLRLKTNYPDVTPILANAAHLPFKNNVFSRIEIVFPYGELMVPGLQNDHFALLEKHRRIYTQNYPHGWYPEFQRVLLPQRELIVYGDLSVDPLQVQKTSQGFFTVETVHNLTVEEFAALGTHTTKYAFPKNRGLFIKEIGRKWEDMLVRINLRSCKTP